MVSVRPEIADYDNLPPDIGGMLMQFSSIGLMSGFASAEVQKEAWTKLAANLDKSGFPWRDPDDFCRIVLEGDYEPARYRAWVAERYSLALQLARIGAVFGELERGIRAEAAGRTAPAPGR